ncbi:MAG: DUF932 domain-containing protein [bacterium]
MAHLVESMMYVREIPWHGLGRMVQDAPNSFDALRLAGLDWNVEQREIQLVDGDLIPNAKANVRSSDNSVLGIVTDRYKIVQNVEAFAFTDALIGDDVRYETAGSLQNGRKVWMLAQLPETKVLGDKVVPYICFTNSHDGTGAVRAMMTPIRVVCNNTLNIALDSTPRQWSMTHTGDLEKKLEEAKYTLELANTYMYELNKQAEIMSKVKISGLKLEQILKSLFPYDEILDSNRKKENMKALRSNFMKAYGMVDIVNFKGTAWGVVNAMTDMVAHTTPLRQTDSFKANNWDKIMSGHVLVDNITKLALAV